MSGTAEEPINKAGFSDTLLLFSTANLDLWFILHICLLNHDTLIYLLFDVLNKMSVLYARLWPVRTV